MSGTRRRIGWVGWTVLGMAGAVGVLVLIWVAWAWYAQRALDREVEKVRARGEPLRVEDLPVLALPDEANAVVLLGKAAQAASDAVGPGMPEVPAASAASFPEGLPYPPKWHRMMEAAYQSHATVYPAVRRARQVGQGAWVRDTEPDVREFGRLRHLAVILADTALYHHFKGNDAEALATLHDLYFLADMADRLPSFSAKLSAWGIRDAAMHRTVVVATELKLGNSENPTGAKREDVLQLMRRLADEEATRQQFIAGLREDRYLMVGRLESPEVKAYVIRPAQLLDAAEALRRAQREIDGVEHPMLPLGTPAPYKPKAIVWPTSALDWHASPVTQGASDPGNSASRLWVMQLARHRCTRIALAMALYRCDHGRYPESLGELVPAHLDAVPRDPTAVDGGEIRYYLAADGKRPVLCMAGHDGVVQTKSAAEIPTQVMYGWQRGTGVAVQDQYRDLSAWTDPNAPPWVEPAAPPADTGGLPPEAVMNDAQQAEAPGQGNAGGQNGAAPEQKQPGREDQ